MIHNKDSDFWWLSIAGKRDYKYITLMHQEPYSDEPNTDKEPYSVSLFYSIDMNDSLPSKKRIYLCDYINKWRKKCSNINIFRSIELYADKNRGNGIIGPFIINIDRSEYIDGKGYVQDLNASLEAVRQIGKDYLGQLIKSDYRLFFTGHKGFSIEIIPSAIGCFSLMNREKDFRNMIGDINKRYGAGFIDNYHDHITLHNSINRWIDNEGNEINRMKIELNITELNNLDIEKIKEKSEKML